MPKQELILPPPRMPAERRDAPSGIQPVRVSTGGIIGSAVTRWHANAQSRAVDALARLDSSRAALVGSHTQLIQQTIRNRDELAKLAEQPERLAHEYSVRRVQRANEFREVQHTYEVGEVRRLKELAVAETELTHARATLTHARTVLLDAQQQYVAQKKHGSFTYELEHRKKATQLLDIELSEAEKRSLLRKHMQDDPPQLAAPTESDEEIDDALLARKQQFEASGLDTTRIEKVMASRRRK